MQRDFYICLIVFLYYFIGFSQTNEIHIEAELYPETKQIIINQEIIYFNNSESTLDTIFLHNWSNAYKNRSTPLSRRLIENYDKSLYFAKTDIRGFSRILSIDLNNQSSKWADLEHAEDILKIILNDPLKPGDSVTIKANFIVKIPIDKFTEYGYKFNNFNLRYWYLTPAVYDGKWQLMSNLNMDDIYMNPSNYKIHFKVPIGYTLHSDLDEKVDIQNDHVLFQLAGENRVDIELNIQLHNNFSIYKTDSLEVISNLKSKNLTENVKTGVLNRQLEFIKKYLGEYPNKRLLVNDVTYFKNPVYGFNQLPKRFTPFSDVFEWDIQMFKALTNRYIENTIIVNKRADYWVPDGIQIFLMIEYVNKFYPEIKAIGNISKVWGLKRYNISKLDFNEKYPFVYQFSMRKNIDQSLMTVTDSLSVFNWKITNKYKAGLGLRYLDEFVGDSIIKNSLNEFYTKNRGQLTNSDSLNKILNNNSNKDIDWFFNDYLKTNKKIDYTITKVEKLDDSVKIHIKNKRNFSAPVALYGLDDDSILFKQWVENIDSTKIVTVKKGDLTRLSLNYEYLYPELNLRNNWKKVNKKLFNRPLKFTFFKDVENPNYNQIFYNLYFGYNFYDGLILGPDFYNQGDFKKKWLFQITPKYGFKSKTITGGFSLSYQFLPENSIVQRYRVGIGGSNGHYNEGLIFNKLTPFVQINFKRKSLRDVGGKSFLARYVIVDKEIPAVVENPEIYKYNVLDIRYGFSQPNIINDLRYFADFQISKDFSKISLDFRYRKLTDSNRQLDFRLFFGTFLFNNTESDFFSFALDRPSDYLFDYNYLGRSETSGFLSQQIIIAEGGFKTIFENQWANQGMLTTNISIGLWRWVEAYADAGFIKNKNQNPYFRYDSGIRLNFVHNFLEIYFPVQSSLGFEPSMPNYASKIRYVITLDLNRIYNFIKRGFY